MSKTVRRLVAVPIFMVPAFWGNVGLADVSVTYTESAPADIVSLRNNGICETGPFTLVIDLSTSLGGVIFDTEGGGAGVSSWQSFDAIMGAEYLARPPAVTDGGLTLTLYITGMNVGDVLRFGIDLDDTKPESAMGPTYIEPDEIAGAVAFIDLGDAGWGGKGPSGTFGPDGRATVPFSACLS